MIGGFPNQVFKQKNHCQSDPDVFTGAWLYWNICDWTSSLIYLWEVRFNGSHCDFAEKQKEIGALVDSSLWATKVSSPEVRRISRVLNKIKRSILWLTNIDANDMVINRKSRQVFNIAGDGVKEVAIVIADGDTAVWKMMFSFSNVLDLEPLSGFCLSVLPARHEDMCVWFYLCFLSFAKHRGHQHRGAKSI